MSVHRHAVENHIAVATADGASRDMLVLGAPMRDAIAEWHRVYREVQAIARRPDVDDLPR